MNWDDLTNDQLETILVWIHEAILQEREGCARMMERRDATLAELIRRRKTKDIEKMVKDMEDIRLRYAKFKGA